MTHGSKEYIEYLSDLLTFEDDEEIKKIPEYEEIKVYASIYLSEYDKEMIGADLGYILGFYPRMPKSMRDKTLQELKNESHWNLQKNY